MKKHDIPNVKLRLAREAATLLPIGKVVENNVDSGPSSFSASGKVR